MTFSSLCTGKVTFDFDAGTASRTDANGTVTHSLSSTEGFALAADTWLRAGWDAKYVYSFTWLGRPVIQLPDDMLRLQEIIYQVQPDLIIETGVAHGGGLVFMASLCKLIGKGRVLGVEIDLRAHNRTALEAHALRPYYDIIDGSSIAPETVEKVKRHIRPGEKVLVILDSCHSAAHVSAELEAYGALVSEGSYLIAADGIMQRLPTAPRSQPDWGINNPITAVEAFLHSHPEFKAAPLQPAFNEGSAQPVATYWPAGYLRRKSG